MMKLKLQHKFISDYVSEILVGFDNSQGKQNFLSDLFGFVRAWQDWVDLILSYENKIMVIHPENPATFWQTGQIKIKLNL